MTNYELLIVRAALTWARRKKWRSRYAWAARRGQHTWESTGDLPLRRVTIDISGDMSIQTKPDTRSGWTNQLVAHADSIDQVFDLLVAMRISPNDVVR